MESCSQVLSLLAKCHGRGIALRRVRPSQLRVTAAGAVFADTMPAPPTEIALYAAPEELGLTGPAQPLAVAPASVSPALGLTTPASRASGSGAGAAARPLASGGPGGPGALAAMAADMFSLGILFFELFHPIPGGAAGRARTIGELRHRILPMDLLQVRLITFPGVSPGLYQCCHVFLCFCVWCILGFVTTGTSDVSPRSPVLHALSIVHQYRMS